jgi:hypothetical protein
MSLERFEFKDQDNEKIEEILDELVDFLVRDIIHYKKDPEENCRDVLEYFGS